MFSKFQILLNRVLRREFVPERWLIARYEFVNELSEEREIIADEWRDSDKEMELYNLITIVASGAELTYISSFDFPLLNY